MCFSLINTGKHESTKVSECSSFVPILIKIKIIFWELALLQLAFAFKSR